MHIAQVAPLYESVPPSLYGGTERVVAHLCDALVELGHEVTLFAAADANTRARLVSVRKRAIRLDPAPFKSDLAAHLSMLDEVRRRASQFDILHFHVDMVHFPLFEPHAHRTVTTLHGRLDVADLPDIYQRWAMYGLVSISDHQRRALPHGNWLATAPHGVPPWLYDPPSQPRADYLAFLGRISPEKRPDIAIRIARQAGLPLRIAGKIDAVDAAYFESIVRPLLASPHIRFIGEIGDDAKSDFLGNARALLFPIDWPEPFGLVMIEAMACGTPVIAWNRGSVPEVIEDGLTGFIVKTEEEALAAVARVDTLDRARIRAEFERRFSSMVMARTYLDIYANLLSRRPLRRVS